MVSDVSMCVSLNSRITVGFSCGLMMGIIIGGGGGSSGDRGGVMGTMVVSWVECGTHSMYNAKQL